MYDGHSLQYFVCKTLSLKAWVLHLRTKGIYCLFPEDMVVHVGDIISTCPQGVYEVQSFPVVPSALGEVGDQRTQPGDCLPSV